MSQFIEKGGVAQLQLTMAINDYDHLRDLATGAVRPEGIVLTPLVFPVEEIFFRFTYHQEWDISEMSFAKYVSLTAAGDAPMIAVPIFPSRVFRHSAFYVRSDSGIDDPAQLQGKTVGIPEWAQTAGVYVRGLLNDYYNVDLNSIKWIQAGVNQAGRKEKVNLSLPEGINYSSRQDESLNDMLLSGEIDVAITARPPVSFHDPKSGVRRIFSDSRVQESKFYKDTGIFPIMHVIAMRRDVFEANRWIAMNLFKAFEEAKHRSIIRLTDITASSIPMPGQSGFVEQVKKDFGNDFWPYGVQDNLPTLEAFCRYAYEQGVASRHLKVEELFPKEVLSSVKV
ncbi:MAG: 4,5-dihydroxyphthalate decarboxylase [Gammaproteobacteria bacterium]|jgi:4,5-dihydroxyphthalate decarboxylase